MIDMSKIDNRSGEPIPTQAPPGTQNQIVGGAPVNDGSGAFLGGGQGADFFNSVASGANSGVNVTGLPDPVDNLYKWATYNQGPRPNAWTNFGDYQDQWDAMGANAYRNPSWPGHMIWQPYWGFTNINDFMGQLKGGYTGDIQGMEGLTRHGDWWETYDASDIFGPDTTEWPSSQPGGGGGNDGTAGSGWDWGNYGDWVNQQGQMTVPQGQWSDPYTMGEPNFAYPEQWDLASNTMGKYAMGVDAPTPWYWDQAGQGMRDASQTGLPTDIPWQWTSGSDFARGMMQTGDPTSQDPWYQQAKGVAQTDIEDAIKQAAEQAGLSGMRWSTPMGRSAQDIAGRTMANVGLEWTGREMDALEQARQRQIQASGQMMGYGQGMAGLKESAAGRQMQSFDQLTNLGSQIANMRNQEQNRQLQAAGQLQGMGQDYLNAPQQYAMNMYNMGSGMQQQQQQAYDRSAQDFYRMSPENNPWISGLFNLSGLSAGMSPEMFNPSFLTQLFSALF